MRLKSTHVPYRYKTFLETIWPKIGRNEFYYTYVADVPNPPRMKALHIDDVVIKTGNLSVSSKSVNRWKLAGHISDVLTEQYGNITPDADAQCKQFNEELSAQFKEKMKVYHQETRKCTALGRRMRVLHDQKELIKTIYDLVGSGEFTYRYLVSNGVPVTPRTSSTMEYSKLFEKVRKHESTHAWFYKLTQSAIQAVQE